MKNISFRIVVLLLWYAIAFAQDATPPGTPLPAGDGIGLSPSVVQSITTQFPKHERRSNRCKGAFLRTKVVSSKKSYKVSAELLIVPPFQQPALKLSKQEFRTITEVRLYEMLLRTFTPGEDEDHGTYDYERIDGEVWEGETTERTVLHNTVPLRSTKVTINGIEFMTDDNGIVQDPNGSMGLLETFDDLGTRKANFLIDVPELGSVDFPMTRTMPKRRPSDERTIDEDERYELLVAYGLDFALSKGEPEQKLLQVKAILPEDFAYAQAGIPFPLKIRVTNPSNRQTSCLLARSFSRCRGLDGKLFYFGAIPPGKTMEFTRMVTVDKTEKTNSAYLELRFSDSWGILTQKIPLSFTVIH